jgi:hypothetical protein
MILSESGTDLLFMWCMKCKRNEGRVHVYLFVLLPNLLIVFSQTYVFVGRPRSCAATIICIRVRVLKPPAQYNVNPKYKHGCKLEIVVI